MELGLAGSRVLITGGASGIGLACAVAFAAEGALITVVDRAQDGLERLRAAVPRSAEEPRYVRADVADEQEVGAAVSRAAEGGLRTLVCCAGISGPVGTPLTALSAADWDRVMAVNVRGAFLVARGAAPYLAASSDASIVMLASDSSFVAAPGMSAYCASKGALLMLCKALAVDLAPDGIRVNCVCPSIVDTPMSREDLVMPDGFSGAAFPVISAEEIAMQVVFLASGVCRSVSGTSLLVDHGLTAKSNLPA